MLEPTFISDSSIRDVNFGKDVRIVRPVNLYGCNIGDNVFVGPFVEIQSGVVIGDRTKVQSHSFVCELVTIGQDCVISHGVMFINDVFKSGKPANGDKSIWRATVIGDRVLIGAGTTILPVEICSDVVIGAGSTVTSNITKPGIYAGNPARFFRSLR
jgi:acetyltransferase-like isoleucine patch superfamily enzyme